jgi:hypothetical protein
MNATLKITTPQKHAISLGLAPISGDLVLKFVTAEAALLLFNAESNQNNGETDRLVNELRNHQTLDLPVITSETGENFEAIGPDQYMLQALLELKLPLIPVLLPAQFAARL